MPTDGSSVHMPIIIIKLRGAEQESVPYMMKVRQDSVWMVSIPPKTLHT